MTRFASEQVVRCPKCHKLVKRQHFASINISGGLFPDSFQNIARGQVVCPHCGVDVDSADLPALVRLNEKWLQGVWAGIPTFKPRIE